MGIITDLFNKEKRLAAKKIRLERDIRVIDMEAEIQSLEEEKAISQAELDEARHVAATARNSHRERPSLSLQRKTRGEEGPDAKGGGPDPAKSVPGAAQSRDGGERKTTARKRDPKAATRGGESAEISRAPAERGSQTGETPEDPGVEVGATEPNSP